MKPLEGVLSWKQVWEGEKQIVSIIVSYDPGYWAVLAQPLTSTTVHQGKKQEGSNNCVRISLLVRLTVFHYCAWCKQHTYKCEVSGTRICMVVLLWLPHYIPYKSFLRQNSMHAYTIPAKRCGHAWLAKAIKAGLQEGLFVWTGVNSEFSTMTDQTVVPVVSWQHACVHSIVIIVIFSAI